MTMRGITCVMLLVLCMLVTACGNNDSSRVSGTVDLLVNGSFESSLTGWSTATQLEAGAAGTCGYNGVTAPGTETITGLPGFAATDGTKTVLGSVKSTGAAFIITCVLYQDVLIPAGATTANFSYDIGAKGGVDGGIFTAARVGIYPTTAVPGFNTATKAGTASMYYVAVADTTLHSVASTSNFLVSSVAGTTVRFAILNGGLFSGGEMIGIDNVKFSVFVP